MPGRSPAWIFAQGASDPSHSRSQSRVDPVSGLVHLVSEEIELVMSPREPHLRAVGRGKDLDIACLFPQGDP